MDAENLGYRPFDADNHYYESEDAFTRHVPPEWQPRCVQWVAMGKRKYHLVGGKMCEAVVNPTFNPVAKPGALHKYFRGNPEGKSAMEYLQDREPTPPEYMNRDARIERLDQQGVESVWLFPTLGVLYEELLVDDPEAVKVLFRGFNRWIEEDWGFAYKNRIFAAPYISLVDVDFAVEELEWALDKGARQIVLRPAAVFTEEGAFSPGNERFDPFWARVNEAGICTVIHAGDSGYTTHGYVEDGFRAGSVKKMAPRPSIKDFNIERAAYDWLITMSFDKIYERFPNLRVASVENGSGFLGGLFKKLQQNANKAPGWFKEDPAELFKEKVWINPFWEDDVYEVVEYMGPDRVIFGSDWPHIEGMPQPLDYVVELKDFDEATQRKILLENATELNTPKPL